MTKPSALKWPAPSGPFRATIVAGVLLAFGCSGPAPVLYPNAHFQSKGKEAAEDDIEACRDMAEAAGAKEGTGQAGQVATNTAVGAGVGAASGAVGGAISGAAGSRQPVTIRCPIAAEA